MLTHPTLETTFRTSVRPHFQSLCVCPSVCHVFDPRQKKACKACYSSVKKIFKKLLDKFLEFYEAVVVLIGQSDHKLDILLQEPEVSSFQLKAQSQTLKMNSYDSLLLFLFKSMKFHVSKLFSKEEQKTSHNFGHFSPSPLPEVEHADPELLLGDSTVAVSVKRPGGVREDLQLRTVSESLGKLYVKLKI